MNKDLQLQMTYPHGESEADFDVKAIEEGLLCNHYNVISWEWIDAAKQTLFPRRGKSEAAPRGKRGRRS
jgi:hypothetical protein